MLEDEHKQRVYEQSDIEHLPQINSDYSLNRFEYDDGFYFERITPELLKNNFFSDDYPNLITTKAYSGNFKDCDFCVYKNNDNTYSCMFKLNNKNIPDFDIKKLEEKNEENPLSCIYIFLILFSFINPGFFILVIIFIVFKMIYDKKNIKTSQDLTLVDVKTQPFGSMYEVHSSSSKDTQTLNNIFNSVNLCETLSKIFEQYGNLRLISNNILILRKGTIEEKEIKNEIQSMLEYVIKVKKRLSR